jgi:hypothetical protein
MRASISHSRRGRDAHRGTPLAALLDTMMGSGLRRAALLLAAASGCFTPRYEDCHVACTSDEDCAPGHACSAAGLCAAPGDPLVCGAPAAPDAAVSPVGMYSVALTNQENGCGFPDWAPGATSNVEVKIREDKLMLAADPQGSLASLLMSWLGSHTFRGPYQGARLELVLAGSKLASQQSCTYTFDVTLDATLDGDLLDGSMLYRARTNGVSACGALNGCASRQALHATRSAP